MMGILVIAGLIWLALVLFDFYHSDGLPDLTNVDYKLEDDEDGWL